MGIIQELDIGLANKIAAGEVVERPSSVVKELVENAIDAGSTEIIVQVKEAGLQMIKVTDNGDGMVKEDLTKAIGRHATSKIQHDHDLFHIRTLGFRGEALASITAVSKVRIKSCADGLNGHEIAVEGSKVISESPARAKQGTEITVEELFYNTPARLKYVKSLYTELGKITDMMNRFAISHPHIRFELIADDKEVLKTSGNGRLNEVLAIIYGMKIARDLIAIEGETGDYKVTGMIARPEHTRANRHYLSIFINGRYIKNFMLTKAILQGFHTLLPIGRYPIAVLMIEMDPALVDVNVHPTKQEVRLSKEAELMTLIEQLIKNALLDQSLIPHIDVQKKNKAIEKYEQPQFDYSATFSREENTENRNQSSFSSYPREAVPLNEINEVVKESSPVLENQVPREQYSETDRQIPVETHEPLQPRLKSEPDVSEQQNEAMEKTRKIPYMEVVGQVHGTYIIAQNESGMFMIDQHAAQERIKYEYFKERIGDVTPEVQPLLFPISLHFTADEAMKLSKHQAALQSVGIELEHFGGNDYNVQAVPTWFPAESEETVKDIIEYCLQHKQVDLNKFREDTAIMMSCKKSIKANHYLRTEDMNRLIEELSRTTEPYTCPHGRPITIQFTSYELEKLFKRVM